MMKWATGVTVAPRKNPTFDRCIKVSWIQDLNHTY